MIGYLLLGSNLGKRIAHLEHGIELLKDKHVKIIRKSSIYESEPWGLSNQPWFLNICLEIEWDKTPRELLEICLVSEEMIGRTRFKKWGPRIIDIDILYLGNNIISSPELVVPHPQIPNRRFTLGPLVELASGFVHPENGLNQMELLNRCKDKLQVRSLEIVK